MRRNPLFALCTAAVVVAACDPEGIIEQTPPSLAGLRYVNVVSDTGALSFRVVDVVSYAPNAINASFRTGGAPQGLPTAFLPPHLPVDAGTRRIRVFNWSTDPTVAQQVLLDTTYTFQANNNYTVYLFGFARTGQTPAVQALITLDNPAPSAAGNFAFRALHLAPTLDLYATTPVDVFVAARGGAPLAGTPAASNQAFQGTSNYVDIPVGTYRAAVTAMGTTTPLLFQANMPTGTVGTPSLNPIAGTLVEGSAITALIAPRSVPASTAPFPFTAVQGVTLTSNLDSTVTAVTPAAHGLATGASVRINGADTSVYNGTFTVTVVNATTYTYRASRRTTGSPATGFTFWLAAAEEPSFNGQPVSRLTAVGTTATLTTLASHGLATNDVVTVSGATDAAYNGSFAVTVTSGIRFTYTTIGTPAASPATGAVLWRTGAADFSRPNILFLIDRNPPRTAP